MPNMTNPLLDHQYSALDQLSGPNRVLVPFLACGDLSGYDADLTYPLQVSWRKSMSDRSYLPQISWCHCMGEGTPGREGKDVTLNITTAGQSEWRGRADRIYIFPCRSSRGVVGEGRMGSQRHALPLPGQREGRGSCPL